MVAAHTSLTEISGALSSMNASREYLAKVKQMIASCDGLSTRVDTHENRNAGTFPNASWK